MRKGKMLNSEIVYTLSKMGHTDTITIADAGLPMDNNVKRIDLALTKNIPSFLEVFKTIKDEMVIEKAIIAKEIVNINPTIYEEIKKNLNNIEIELVTHEEFKVCTKTTKAVVRTGECSPYANIILVSGVDFGGVENE